jgi:(R)-benzylsuccinyl-CoA dehydrogenase
MDFSIPFELKMLRDSARRFTEEELIPREREYLDAELRHAGGVEAFQAEDGVHYSGDPLGVMGEEAHRALLERARAADLWGLDLPEEFGGKGAGGLAKVLVVEEMSRSLTPFTLPPDSPNLHWLLAVCTEEQRERYLQPYARGELNVNLAVTEPGAGSDAAGITTRAVRDGDGWVINGRKTFISGADWADMIIVLAKTDPSLGARGGVTAFLVDRGTPGLRVERRIATITSMRPCELSFTDLRVPDGQVLGTVGWAFPELQNRFSVRRLEIAARCLGVAERLLDMLVEQAHNRVTFGEPLANRQAIQWWIADATAAIHATRLVVYNAACKFDQGERDLRYEASIAKVMATEMVSEIADNTLQAHGGMGLTKDLPIEHFYRMVRVWRILEGPSEIHRYVIARNRLKGKKPRVDLG